MIIGLQKDSKDYLNTVTIGLNAMVLNILNQLLFSDTIINY